LPICSGGERLKDASGDKAHSTQKPEACSTAWSWRRPSRAMWCSIRSSAPARRARWRAGSAAAFIGIERDPKYARLARARIAGRTAPTTTRRSHPLQTRRSRASRSAGWSSAGLLPPGTVLHGPQNAISAKVRADGTLVCADATGSIHRIAAHVQGLDACNGWTFWHFESNGKLVPIDVLRQRLRADLA
jgi:modification methylase